MSKHFIPIRSRFKDLTENTKKSEGTLKNVLIQDFVENLVKPFQELIENLLNLGMTAVSMSLMLPQCFLSTLESRKEQADHGKEIKEELPQARQYQHGKNLVQEHLEIFSLVPVVQNSASECQV